MSDLVAFVAESNGIEGIWREPWPREIEAHQRLLAARRISVPVLVEFVATVAPGHRLRDRKGLDVRVGAYEPPPGGREIREMLRHLLTHTWETRHPLLIHREYEKLHPFTDGNGRSGRALWAWHMRKIGRDPFALRFLHRWYYDTLETTT